MPLTSPTSFAVQVDLENALTLTDDANCDNVADTDGLKLTKTGGGAAWNAGAYSNLSIASGKDGWVDGVVETAATDVWMLGLNANASASSAQTDIDFGLQKNTTNYTILESNSLKATISQVPVAGDRLRVSLDGGVVRYYINGVLAYTSVTSPTYPLFLDASINVGLIRQIRMGVWTDISSDVLFGPGAAVEAGIQGAGPADVLASPGTMRFQLVNTTSSSGGVLGYYSPEHASRRTNWGLQRRARIRIAHGGTTRSIFTGWIDSIEPVLARHNEIVDVTVADWFDHAMKTRLNVATQTNKRSDQVLKAVVAAVPRQPTAVRADAGDSTFAYSLDSSESENQTAYAEIQRITQSEYGLCYIDGDGVLRYRNRSSRLTLSAVASFIDDILALRPRYESGAVLNKIKVTTHPRRVDSTATTVLATNQGTPSVAPGATLKVTLYYTDPELRASRIGGVDMVTPVSTTDYLMNSKEDGTGTNLTASFTVTASFGANSAEITLVNGAASTGYITKLQVRGRGLYDYDPVESEASSSSSILTYGEAQYILDQPYQPSASLAAAIAEYLISVWATPAAQEIELEFLGNTSATFMGYALDVGVGSVVSVVETATAINSVYTVHSRALTLTARGRTLHARWGLAKGKVGSYWTLDSATKSQLGTTTIVAPL